MHNHRTNCTKEPVDASIQLIFLEIARVDAGAGVDESLTLSCQDTLRKHRDVVPRKCKRLGTMKVIMLKMLQTRAHT